jgi:hypothetical protein
MLIKELKRLEFPLVLTLECAINSYTPSAIALLTFHQRTRSITTIPKHKVLLNLIQVTLLLAIHQIDSPPPVVWHLLAHLFYLYILQSLLSLPPPTIAINKLMNYLGPEFIESSKQSMLYVV